MLHRYITVRGQYEGWHEYENAPEPVAFLRSEHRHMFHWEATIEVFHDDRELEFFLVKLELEREIQYFINQTRRKGLGSCEMQAQRYLDFLIKKYGTWRYVKVSVSEDGESDGTTEWIPHS